jgi:hypothetical protein
MTNIKRERNRLLAILIVPIILNILLLGAICRDVYGAERLVYFQTTSDSVQVTWQRNAEPDMAQYVVYLNGAKWRYIDHPDTVLSARVNPAKFYQLMRFSLTAADNNGNESAFSDTISAYFSQERTLNGDVDSNGAVDIVDIMLINVALGAMPGDAQFSERKDLNGDGALRIDDKALLLQNLGARI